MEQPQSPMAVICPHCGAEQAAPRSACWICGQSLPELSSPPKQPPPDPVPDRGITFSLSTLLLVTTIAAVCCGLFTAAPGLGIFVCILLAPALVRTAMVVRRRQARGHPVSTAQKAGLLLTSLVVAQVILIVVAFAAVGTFCAVCLSAGDERAIPAALLAGALIVIPVIVLMVKWVRVRFRRDTQ
jgi:hypothetical protein